MRTAWDFPRCRGLDTRAHRKISTQRAQEMQKSASAANPAQAEAISIAASDAVG